MKPHILLCLFAIIALFSCNKEAKQQPGSTDIVSVTGIRYYGSPFTHCQLCFTALGSGAKSYRWTSDDGATSTAAVFCHTYTKEGDHDVQVTINDDPSYSTSLTVDISESPPGISAHVAGKRTWRFSEGETFMNGTNTIAFKGYADLEIMYIDPATVRIGDDTLRLFPVYNSTNYEYTRTTLVSGRRMRHTLRLRRWPADSLYYNISHSLTDASGPDADAFVKEYRSP